MTRRIVFMLVFLLILTVSVFGVFAQENGSSTPGETEVLAFFNNLGANVQTNSNDIPEVNTNEPNWCTQSNRWGDGRCNNADSWVQRYNWYIGWVLAHCEIPGYFSLENWPEVCKWGLNASPDEVYRTLFPSAGNIDNNDNGSVIVVTEPTEATPTEATPTEATPTEATPTEATPTEATPTEATPTEATPTEATPTEATPTEATPTEATPTEATPTEATPTEATPTEATPTEATPTEPANVTPTASFGFSCTNLACSFDGNGSSDSDGSIVSYSWSFGATGSTASNTFAGTGTYSVSLTVTDDDGATASTSQSVTVTAAPPANVAPTANFIVNCANLSCTVNASGSVDSDGTMVSYAWDFGDSSSGSGVTMTKSYGAGGTFTIILTVTDDDGATASTTKIVAVTAPNASPTASFTFSCTNLVCDFNGSASTDSDGSIVSYSWSFGATGSTVSNTFASAGTHSVTLTVTDNLGATATATNNVIVSATTSLSASYTCSGTNITVVITAGDSPFTISGGGSPVSAPTVGSYPIGTRNGNITVTETGGDLQSLALGNKLCQ